jgi:predicted Zn-dependent peptidase
VCSYFVIGGNSDDPEAVYSKFCEYAENKLKNGISAESVELAKRTLYSECVSSFESSENIAENMFESFLVGEQGLDKAEAYAAVTYEQVCEMAAKVLDERRFALSVIYPKNR